MPGCAATQPKNIAGARDQLVFSSRCAIELTSVTECPGGPAGASSRLIKATPVIARLVPCYSHAWDQGGKIMPGIARALALTSAIFLLAAAPALAQKSGGVLKFFHRDSPASGSIHEEATISAVAPFMGVFNNLVLFNQHEKQNRIELIEPELAESWKWNNDFTRVSFQLRQGVRWHDGKPFTAKDVKCTWD